MKYIYHITTQQVWDAAQKAGVYTAPSLETEGFIHCSTLQQVIPVANAFYKDVPDLLLLEIEIDRLEAEVKWEAPAHPDPDNPPEVNDREQFPHVYSVIDANSVRYTSVLKKDHQNKHQLSDEMQLIAENASIDDVIPTLFHLLFELRSPANAIKGFSKVLLMAKAEDIVFEDKLSAYETMHKAMHSSSERIVEVTHIYVRLIRYLQTFSDNGV